MFCGKCGNPIGEGHKFCGKCGAPVVVATPDTQIKYFEMSGYKFHFPINDSEETAGWTVTVNLTEKNIKIDVPDQTYIKNVYLWHDDNRIRGLVGDDTIFEITNRSKAYEEILPYVRHKSKAVTITKREGNYGTYYSVKVRFEVVIDDSGTQYT